jgi:hypothetical protein
MINMMIEYVFGVQEPSTRDNAIIALKFKDVPDVELRCFWRSMETRSITTHDIAFLECEYRRKHDAWLWMTAEDISNIIGLAATNVMYTEHRYVIAKLLTIAPIAICAMMLRFLYR